jgi:hypothetical protein
MLCSALLSSHTSCPAARTPPAAAAEPTMLERVGAQDVTDGCAPLLPAGSGRLAAAGGPSEFLRRTCHHLPTHKLVHLQGPMPIGAPATCSFLFLDPSTHNLAAFARKLNPRSIARSGYATILHLGKGETNMKNKDG